MVEAYFRQLPIFSLGGCEGWRLEPHGRREFRSDFLSLLEEIFCLIIVVASRGIGGGGGVDGTGSWARAHNEANRNLSLIKTIQMWVRPWQGRERERERGKLRERGISPLLRRNAQRGCWLGKLNQCAIINFNQINSWS